MIVEISLNLLTQNMNFLNTDLRNLFLRQKMLSPVTMFLTLFKRELKQKRLAIQLSIMIKIKLQSTYREPEKCNDSMVLQFGLQDQLRVSYWVDNSEKASASCSAGSDDQAYGDYGDDDFGDGDESSDEADGDEFR